MERSREAKGASECQAWAMGSLLEKMAFKQRSVAAKEVVAIIQVEKGVALARVLTVGDRRSGQLLDIF